MSFLRRAVLGTVTMLAAVMLVVSPATAAPSEQDTAWMVSAHQGNLAEIAAGTAAREHGSTEEVRNMGLVLVEEHQTLDAALTAAAEELAVELPTEPSAQQRAALEEVMAQDGEAFDAAWIASQIEGHRMSLAAGQEEIDSGSDPSVIALAQDAAPVVQGHLDHLLQMSGDTPGSVPSGLGGTGSPSLLGVSLIGLGLLAVAGSVLSIFLRRGRARA
jgi:putative membrane protein